MQLSIEYTPISLSWSFYGDMLSAAGANVSLWHFGAFEKESAPEHPIWTSDQSFEQASLSPKGRLLATLKSEGALVIWYRPGGLPEGGKFNKDTLRPLKLKHQGKIMHYEWRDVPNIALYQDYYVPNSLLTISRKFAVKIWTEFSTP